MLLALSAVAQAQNYQYTYNPDNTVTLAKYIVDPGAVLNIPETFYDGSAVFPVTAIGDSAFDHCFSLTSVTIPDSVTNIGNYAFYFCTNLVTVTIGANVTFLDDFAFGNCTSLSNVYFQGNAPNLGGSYVFDSDDSATIYYLPDATNGWPSLFAGLPAILWNPHVLNNASFGIHSNSFGFTISGTTNINLVVESCTNLLNPAWSPVTNLSLTGGTALFSDAHWTNHPQASTISAHRKTSKPCFLSKERAVLQNTMNTRERFHAVMKFRPFDRLPILEWAGWWDKTLARWREEGLPPGVSFKNYPLDLALFREYGEVAGRLSRQKKGNAP